MNQPINAPGLIGIVGATLAVALEKHESTLAFALEKHESTLAVALLKLIRINQHDHKQASSVQKILLQNATYLKQITANAASGAGLRL